MDTVWRSTWSWAFIVGAMCIVAGTRHVAAVSPGEGPAAVRDVVRSPEGYLLGRVVPVGTFLETEPWKTHAGAPTVTLVERGRPVASAVTDQRGYFALPTRRSGVFVLHVDPPTGDLRPEMCAVRVWDAAVAPPQARDAALIQLNNGVVRGQSSRGQTAQRALFSAVAAGGAIAVPVTYGAVRDATRIPVSP